MVKIEGDYLWSSVICADVFSSRAATCNLFTDPRIDDVCILTVEVELCCNGESLKKFSVTEVIYVQS